MIMGEGIDLFFNPLILKEFIQELSSVAMVLLKITL